MSQTTPQVAGTATSDEEVAAPRVRVLVSMVEDADLDAALSVIGRQVYVPAPEVVVIGAGGELPEGVQSSESVEDAIGGTTADFDYLWLLHADARPRPDALAALVSEIERNDASLAGSKLLKAGTNDELESVGGATDVFGEPYSGIDEGEIDLQQYDVVREVAFVRSASMLVRRDLAQGLKGLDRLLPPVAAGLDFSQRARLAGGRVISVPSSEVYHQDRCGEERGTGWREQAGRLRAMLIAYSPLTLLWVIPYDFLVSVVDSLASLLLLRWRPLVRHVYSWIWNVVHLPSTIGQRWRLRSVRSEGDEELFRFQASGSLRLRAIGEEFTGRILSLFDDDQALARGTRRLWGSPGIWGAVLAVVIVLIGARSLIFGGMPNTGFSFPFEAPTVGLQRWLGGWNDGGLGSAAAVHPSVGLAALASLAWFGAEGAARIVLTVALAILGLIGMGRLAGKVGLRGPGRYLAGLALLAGPGTAALTQRGSWLAFGAAALLPWAVRSAFLYPHQAPRSKLTLVGWALLTGGLIAFFNPLLVAVPLLTVFIWRALGGRDASYLLALCGLTGAVIGAAFLLGDPGWLIDDARRLGPSVSVAWPILVLVAAAPLTFAGGARRTFAVTGGLLALLSLTGSLLPTLGPGAEEAVLVISSLGTAMVAAAAIDVFDRNVIQLVAAGAGVAIILVSVTSVGDGRLGLPAGDLNERLSFAETLAGDDDPGRVLHLSTDPSLLAGEARSGPGFWYRLVDGTGTSHDEVWLPDGKRGDSLLRDALTDIASGAELRPGSRLAEFAVDWVVLDGPRFSLDDVLVPQLDLAPIPLDPDARVYQNLNALPLAGNEEVSWSRSGTGFAGEVTADPVHIAIDYAEGWQPDAEPDDWSVSVAGDFGMASYRTSGAPLALAVSSIVFLVGGLALIILGARRH